MDEYWRTDAEYYENRVTGVSQYTDGRYEILLDTGMCFAYEVTDDIPPREGEIARFYGERWMPVRGLMVGERLYFYQTRDEVEAERAALTERLRAAERARQTEYDQRYAALPVPFRKRLDSFRRQPDFRETLEGPELQICETALRLAGECGTADAVRGLGEPPFTRLLAAHGWLRDNRPSEGILSVICQLAFWYLQAPDCLTEVPGALEHLGAAGYGREQGPPRVHITGDLS